MKKEIIHLISGGRAEIMAGRGSFIESFPLFGYDLKDYDELFTEKLDDMDAMFAYAPDTRITAHPIKIGSGNITAVTGIMEGNFTLPMPIGNGKFIQPTGKAFKIPCQLLAFGKTV